MNRAFLFLTLLSTSTFLVSCFGNKKVTTVIHGKEQKVEVPPGVVLVEDNLFIDETEVTNQYWRDMTHWHIIVFDLDPMSKPMIPENYGGVVACDSSRLHDPSTYYGFPEFNDHPCVGITRKQALAYCKWRTDRVLGIMLYRSGEIELKGIEDSTSYFSVEKYFSGAYPTKNFNSDLLIPMYTLPSLQEKTYILAPIDSLKAKSHKKEKLKQARRSARLARRFNKHIWQPCETTTNVPGDVYSYAQNTYGIRRASPNVADLTIEEESLITYDTNKTGVIAVDKWISSGNFIGFRCVCRWVTYEEYKNYWENIQ